MLIFELYNTLFGSRCYDVLSVEGVEDDVLSFVGSSNSSLFVCATKSKIIRVTMVEPKSDGLVDCISHRNAKRKCSNVIMSFHEDTPNIQEVSYDKVTPLQEFLEAHRINGVGRVSGCKLKSSSDDNYKHVTLDMFDVDDDAQMEVLIRSHLSSIPPKNLVPSLVKAKNDSLLLFVCEHYKGLSYEDLLTVLEYGVVNEDKKLLRKIWNYQTCDQTLRRHLRSKFPVIHLQTLFVMLTEHLQLNSITSNSEESYDNIIEWICCILDSNPQTFSLDPKMSKKVSEVSKIAKHELESASRLMDMKVVLDIMKYKQMTNTKEKVQDYSIEFLSI